MSSDELAMDEVRALAAAFPVEASRALLLAARYPSYAIPVNGYRNALEFWILVSQEVSAGIMENGRAAILGAARQVFPNNAVFRTTAAGPSAQPAARQGGAGTMYEATVDGSQGVLVGEENTQVNFIFNVGRPPASTASQPDPPPSTSEDVVP
jgi:Effector-associated domain 1